MFRSLVHRFINFLWVWLMTRVIYQHFCKFKEAGSNFKNFHVHILGKGNIRSTAILETTRASGMMMKPREFLILAMHITIRSRRSCRSSSTQILTERRPIRSILKREAMGRRISTRRPKRAIAPKVFSGSNVTVEMRA
jgi:hypothetical protein